MRVDRVIVDTLRSLRQALQTLDNNVTVQDNFGPSGADEGQVIISVGRTRKPVWGSLAAEVTKVVDEIDCSCVGEQGPAGATGPAGADGVDGASIGDWEQLVFVVDPVDPPEDLWAYKADGNPDIVQGWRNY